MAGKRISALTEQTGLSSGDFFGVDNAGQTASKKLNSEYFTKRFANVQNDTAFPTGDAYSSSSSYKVGDYVTHNDVLYRCKTACSAASWTVNATNFEEASLTKAVTELNSALTWKLAGTLDSAHTSISTPSTYEELSLILGNGDGTVGTSIHIPNLNVTAAGRTFRSGYYADGSHYGALDVHVSSSSIDSLTVKLNGSIDSNARCAVYYR